MSENEGEEPDNDGSGSEEEPDLQALADERLIQRGRRLKAERDAETPPIGFKKRTMERLNREIPPDFIPASKANDDRSGQ